MSKKDFMKELDRLIELADKGDLMTPKKGVSERVVYGMHVGAFQGLKILKKNLTGSKDEYR